MVFSSLPDVLTPKLDEYARPKRYVFKIKRKDNYNKRFIKNKPKINIVHCSNNLSVEIKQIIK